MNQENLESLYQQLAAAGFGVQLNDKLKDTIGIKRKCFGLSFGQMFPVTGSVPGNPETHDVMLFELYFKQEALPGTYSFECINAKLYLAGHTAAFSRWVDPSSGPIDQLYKEMKEDLQHLLATEKRTSNPKRQRKSVSNRSVPNEKVKMHSGKRG